MAFQRVTTGFAHNCGLTTTNVLKCWGLNVDGSLSAPINISAGIYTGLYHNCSLTPDGNAVCFGGERYQLNITIVDQNLQTLSLGSFHTCGITADLKLICEGDNSQGQLESPNFLGVDER